MAPKSSITPKPQIDEKSPSSKQNETKTKVTTTEALERPSDEGTADGYDFELKFPEEPAIDCQFIGIRNRSIPDNPNGDRRFNFIFSNNGSQVVTDFDLSEWENQDIILDKRSPVKFIELHQGLQDFGWLLMGFRLLNDQMKVLLQCGQLGQPEPHLIELEEDSKIIGVRSGINS